MPSLVVEDVELAARDDDLVQDLEHSVSEWSLVLGEVMQRESEKHPSGTGPLAGVLAAWLWFPYPAPLQLVACNFLYLFLLNACPSAQG